MSVSPQCTPSLLVALESSLASGLVPDSDGREPDLATLTAAIVRGDEDAFREFHQRYAGRLFAYVLVLHRGDETAARETWQTTFVKTARRMKCFETDEALWAWLATIARRTALDGHRMGSRFARLRERAAAWWSPVQPNTAETDTAAPLRVALARLVPADRGLLEAKYFEQQSVRDIAAASGRTEKAVESALTRARERLRAAFLEELRRG